MFISHDDIPVNKNAKEHIDSIEENYINVLDKFKDGRVFDLFFNAKTDNFVLGEMCDEYFAETLTEKDCRDLAAIFTSLAEYYKDKNK